MIRYTWKCRSYAEVPKGAEIISVNDRDVIGVCPVCDKMIFADDASYVSHEDSEQHLRCIEKTEQSALPRTARADGTGRRAHGEEAAP